MPFGLDLLGDDAGSTAHVPDTPTWPMVRPGAWAPGRWAGGLDGSGPGQEGSGGWVTSQGHVRSGESGRGYPAG